MLCCAVLCFFGANVTFVRALCSSCTLPTAAHYKVDAGTAEGDGGGFGIDDHDDAQRLQRTYSIREEVVR